MIRNQLFGYKYLRNPNSVITWLSFDLCDSDGFDVFEEGRMGMPQIEEPAD
jgi:hypothetical protein